jgi:hypothetical protein
MPVLLSYACFGEWLHNGYQQSFSRILIDSGAYSELTGAAKVDIAEYRAWSEQWRGHADAIAGLDDIRGDWRRSLRNYAEIPWGFPTWHDSDPIELLPDLCAMASERGGWLGIGMVPPREGKERILREALPRVPESLHVHLWAGRLYTHIRRLDSVDSTNWWRDAMKLRTLPDTAHLNYGECLEIVVKRYVRWQRTVREEKGSGNLSLFGEMTA